VDSLGARLAKTSALAPCRVVRYQSKGPNAWIHMGMDVQRFALLVTDCAAERAVDSTAASI